MTVSTYTTLAAELGIDRGALASGEWEMSHRPGSEAFVNPHASQRRVKPPPIAEDLSRFAHYYGHRLTDFKALLAKRGMTMAKLARLAGYKQVTIRQLIYTPGRASATAKAKLKALLTREEWEMVEGKNL